MLREVKAQLAMNVTLKLPDELCREARHRAVDQSKSLSQWMADLLLRELAKPVVPVEKPRTWMDAFSGDKEFLDRDFLLPDRKDMKTREFNFED